LHLSRIILDLCGGTGAWSDPYRQAGYDVRLVTLPAYDVLTYQPPARVHGILAAPPCEHFSVSGAQYWPTKDTDGRTIAALGVVIACLRIIAMTVCEWWAFENPVGRLRRYLGAPILGFDPCDFGDPYTKKTFLWGRFTEPVRQPVTPIRVSAQGSWIQRLGGSSERTKTLRSITPPGFARAFFVANP
jgi:hypothetical protein